MTDLKLLEFDEEKHLYTYGGKVLPSVTEIVGMIDFGQLAKMNPAVLEHAAMRGTLVHEYTEAIDNGYDPEELEVEFELVPYVTAYLDFLRDYRPKWELVEEKLVDQVHSQKYAGTIDRYGVIDGKPTIVDIKTTATADKHTKLKWALQLCGYDVLIESNGYPASESRLIVQLKKDGTYTVHNMTEEDRWCTFFKLANIACEVKELINNGE